MTTFTSYNTFKAFVYLCRTGECENCVGKSWSSSVPGTLRIPGNIEIWGGGHNSEAKEAKQKNPNKQKTQKSETGVIKGSMNSIN